MVSTTTSARCSSGQSAEEKSSPCEALRALKAKAYGFQLAQLNETQMEEKGKEINAFWKQVHADGPAGMACVRSMLEQEKSDHNFQFDAASMLYQTDHSPATLVLGQSGVDIHALAAKFLRYPDAVVHVPEHALDLDSDTAALFLYGSLDPSFASKAL